WRATARAGRRLRPRSARRWLQRARRLSPLHCGVAVTAWRRSYLMASPGGIASTLPGSRAWPVPLAVRWLLTAHGRSQLGQPVCDGPLGTALAGPVVVGTDQFVRWVLLAGNPLRQVMRVDVPLGV